jgi:hypothetical protein
MQSVLMVHRSLMCPFLHGFPVKYLLEPAAFAAALWGENRIASTQ